MVEIASVLFVFCPIFEVAHELCGFYGSDRGVRLSGPSAKAVGWESGGIRNTFADGLE